ncbi:hypothetical protein [Streptomyces sp. NRRL F-5630]|uniref:hypothetical protein n=1 Tax=Streptomyces sp. NRRL F-5630 TaxID=1463864 RepID=UPI003EB8DC2F
MKIRALDGRQAAGTGLVLDMLEHAEFAPPGPWTVDTGRAAVLDGEGAVWVIGEGDVSRLLALSCRCGHLELTTYRDGAEVSRKVTLSR